MAEVDEVATRFDAYRSHRYISIPWAFALPGFVVASSALLVLDYGLLVPIFLALGLGATWLRRENLRVTVDVGADGVQYTSRFEKRFVKWSEVAMIDHDARGVRLRLRGRRPLAFSVVMGDLTTLAAVEAHRDMLEYMRRAHARAEPNANAGLSAQLARGQRSMAEWLASLGGGPSFRSASIREDDLWNLLEDPSAAPTARAGAAIVLAREAKDAERRRLRVAADGCAEPQLRVVLMRSAAGEDATDALEDIDDVPKSATGA